MSTELFEEAPDEQEAVNDDTWTPNARPKKGEICARRRLETLLEARRLERDLTDGWEAWDEEE
ncbi:PA3496 family putative envelope integrity protein [Kushneria sp. TE3]|uniref:PA3496 family putative envelope integrity protein n=1 Tax=Kushneria sp. TE3 TaxID=3449832 RepID=UPI003F686AD4